MHHRTRRTLVAVAAGAVLVATTAGPVVAAPTTGDAPVQVVHDPADDFTNELGEKVDVPAEARGLDVLRVRQRIIGNRLIVLSRHRDLTRRNTNVNPDRTPVKGSFSMFVAYLEPRAQGLNGYSVSFDRHRKANVTYHATGAQTPCPATSKRSRINLERDRVRYVVPLWCIPDLSATRTTAQVIRYKVVKRTDAGVEHIVFAAIDENDRPMPRFSLR
jgi:hypothetical protein